MNNLFGLSKKAQASSWFAVVIFLLVFVFITLISYIILSQFINAMTTAGFYTGAVQKTGNWFLFWLEFFDKVTAFLMLVFIIGAAVTTYKLASGPVFYVVLFVQAAFYGFISYMFNYVFIQIITNSVFSGVIPFFSISIIICTNLHWVMLALIFVGSIAMFGKKEKGQYLA